MSAFGGKADIPELAAASSPSGAIRFIRDPQTNRIDSAVMPQVAGEGGIKFIRDPHTGRILHAVLPGQGGGGQQQSPSVENRLAHLEAALVGKK